DFIMRRGEVDEEFYMINRGSVELATDPDSFERSAGDAGIDEDGSAERNSTGLPRGSRRGDHVEALNSRRFTPESIYRVGVNTDGPANKGHRAKDKYLKQLDPGQAFGEMALLMNYERTANARAITCVEVCVLNRSNFQGIFTKHPEDRKKVVSAMLSTCMVNNEVEGVYCPLKEMVRSVYSEVDPVRGAQIRANEAASLMLDVINPDLEDESIKFGVNAKLERQLSEKRDRDKLDVVREANPLSPRLRVT
ncbi:hypothetical protein Gpo141_00013912, partial [Globisporangium polare]